MREIPISHAAETPGTLRRRQRNPPQRILVVDDDFELRQFSAAVLAHSGFEVDAAADGAIAWEALKTNHYDLLITNHNMPKVCGIELLMKLHAFHIVLPVIMASATLPKDQFARYPWLKPAALLRQPCSVAELVGTVYQVIIANQIAGESFSLLPNRKSQPINRWLAIRMILLRSPRFG